MSVRVIEVAEVGGPEVLKVATRKDPLAGAGEVVVEIARATVNPSDLGARSGATLRRVPDLRLPFVPGWDLCGTVSAVGPGVEGLVVGDRVVGLIPWVPIRGRVGAYAEAAAVEASWLARVPADLDAGLGATVPLGGLTAAQGLELLGAAPGATVLVTGASGAVGWFAAQLARRQGCRVLAVASHQDEPWVERLGVEVVPRSTELERIETVDAVFDAVPLGPSVTAPLRRGGTVVFTRPPPGEPPPGVDYATVWVEPRPAMLEELALQVATGSLLTRVAHELPLGDAPRAHALVEAGGLRGKVVLDARR